MGCCSTSNNVTVPDIENVENTIGNLNRDARIQIKSQLTLNEIKISKCTPKGLAELEFRYGCPICMYYYSNILVTDCCKNYICHYCIEEMKSFKPNSKCPYCKHSTLTLKDPNPKDSIKKYFDRTDPKQAKHAKSKSGYYQVYQNIKNSKEKKHNYRNSI
jgi:hypothetical protein